VQVAQKRAALWRQRQQGVGSSVGVPSVGVRAGESGGGGCAVEFLQVGALVRRQNVRLLPTP